jgi:hypothetical protein
MPHRGATIDINPLALEKVTDWRQPLWITEGVRKGDALVSAGVAAIALYGVWNWRGTDESGAVLRLGDWDEIPLKGKVRGRDPQGRSVYIVFDSDVATNLSVKQALARLGRFLAGRGADVRYVKLDPRPDGNKVGVDDYLAAGGTPQGLRKAARREPPGFQPIVLNGRQDREVIRDVIDVLEATNDPAFVFRWGSVLGRVREDEHGHPITEPYTTDLMQYRMAMVADFFTIRRLKDGTRVQTPAAAPERIAKMVRSADTWPFPTLRGIVETPTVREDGSILYRPGYDAETELWHMPAHDFDIDPVPEQPSRKDVGLALDRLLYLVHDFPFVADADLVNYFGLLLTPLLRPAISGPVPLVGINAPQQGSGKSLLAELASRITTGRPAEVQVAPKGE